MKASLDRGVWAKMLQTIHGAPGSNVEDYGLQTKKWPKTYKVVRYLAQTGWSWGASANTSWHNYRFQHDVDAREGRFWRDGVADATYTGITNIAQCVSPVVLGAAAKATSNPNIN